ncbi:hypothetical protein L218DRAFT_949810 [Marasmius fiardii PR-910]|nr:hypothetical protein L218DRAFT_949810 [Marasmius fiardii PR-910]
MFSPKVITLFIVSMMMTSTAVVAKPGGSMVAQMDSVENAPEDNSKIVHATSVTRSMGPAMIMAAWVSTKFALVERSKDVLVTDLIGWKWEKGPPKESAAPYIHTSIHDFVSLGAVKCGGPDGIGTSCSRPGPGGTRMIPECFNVTSSTRFTARNAFMFGSMKRRKPLKEV